MACFRSPATLFIAALATAISPTAHAEVYRVNAASAPGGDGLDWETAIADLGDALALAGPGDEVWVSAGVYVPSTSDSTVSFVVPSGVRLLGGFTATETNSSQRDPDANITNLSGDVGGDDSFNGTYWTPVYGSLGNSGHVLDASGVSAATVIDGFTISQGGLGPSGTGATNPLLWGSGLYMPNGDARVTKCRFLSNRAAFGPGGAVYVNDGSPIFDHCSFEYNSCHIADGGGLYTGGDGSPTVRDCLFLGNTITFDSIDNGGGGWYNACTQPVLVERCRFVDNAVNPFFSIGGIGYGGGMMSFIGGCDVRNCEFINNRASSGGGLITWGNSTITNTLFYENRAVEQPGSGGIDAGGEGGGLAIKAFQPDIAEVINCTFTQNRANKAAGAIGLWNAALDIKNSILWGNIAANPDLIGFSRAQIGGSYDIERSIVHAIFGPPEPGEDVPDPGNCPACIDADPLFINAPAGDCRLAEGSPAIDASFNDRIPVWANTDLDGNLRFVDNPASINTGTGDRPADLGAYENQTGAPCPADLAPPFGVLDLADVTSFTTGFLAQDPIADIDLNGVFDLADINAFIDAFIAGCP